MNNEFTWGNPAVCINNDGRPARFSKNTLCFVCACRVDADQAANKAKQERRKADRKQHRLEKRKQRKANGRVRQARESTGDDFYEELNDELLEKGQTKHRY